jgi:hypothetical protein
MLDMLTYFRAEIDTVGRQWLETAAGFDAALALKRPNANFNHALWLTAHMTWAEDYLVIEIPTGRSLRRKNWDPLFDHSSEKLPDSAYPPWGEVRAEYGRVHAEVMRHLYQQSPAELARPSALERQWLPTAAHSIAHQVTHGHYHLGQLVYLQKMFAPVVVEHGV